MKIKQYILGSLMTVSTTIAGVTAGAVPFSIVSVVANEVGSVKVEAVSDITSSWTDFIGIGNEAERDEEQFTKSEMEEKAANIDKYFASMNLPLAGYGEAFVKTAEKYDLDYRLLPAIAMRESTGGKFGCPFGNHANVFGWHSCKTKFSSYEEAIDKVGAHLAGEIKSTKSYYGNKSVRNKLRTYNSVIPPYVDQVIAIMNKIEKAPVYESLAKIDNKVLKEVAVK